MISSKSLSYLSQSLQTNTSLQVMKLSSNIILGDLSELCTSIQNSSIKHLDLSKNQLTDSQNPYIISLLKHSTLSSLNLESNQFKSLNLYQVLAENHYIEELSISHNPLSLNEILSVLDALTVNRSLKILGIQGFNNILFDQKLAEVLKRTLLIVLKYDLDIADLKVVKEIEDTLMKFNTSLVSIESKGVDWDNISAKHPLWHIKRALKANLWLSQNDSLPSELNDEIFMDVQEVVMQKMNSGSFEYKNENFEYKNEEFTDEDEMIALEYDKIPEIIPALRQVPEVSEGLSLKIEEKTNFSAILDKFEEKFEKVLSRVSDKVGRIEEKVESQQEELESLKEIISGRLNKLTEQIESEMGNFAGKYKQMNLKLEEKLIQVERKEERKSELLREIAEQYEVTQETLKDLDSRIDEIQNLIRSKPVSKPDPSFSKLSSSQSEIFTQIQDLQDKLLSVSSNSSKLSSFEDLIKKSHNKTDLLKQEFLSWQSEVSQNLLELEEKLSETNRYKPQLSSMQKEIFSKLATIDCKILELSDNPQLQDMSFKMISYENRLAILEEKLAKSLNDTVFSMKHRDQLIESRLAYLEQERLNIEELKSKLLSRNEDSMKDSFVSHEKSLDERIASLEKINTVKKQYGFRENISSLGLR